MLLLTFNAVLKCDHVMGLVINTHAQDWVTVTQPDAGDGRARNKTAVLIEPDPVGRTIIGCPNINVGILPCLLTLSVREGYSQFVSIDGHPVCLKTVVGLTNGSPGVHEYTVSAAGQSFVGISA